MPPGLVLIITGGNLLGDIRIGNMLAGSRLTLPPALQLVTLA